MLSITLSAIDELKASDDTIVVAAEDAVELQLEHSLVSLSKWEEIYEKPFFGSEAKTPEETAEYIRLMIISGNAPEDLFKRITAEQVETITTYINSKRTATWFREESGRRGGAEEVVTSELMYYWLMSFRIPFWPTETWHLNRLMTLVRIAGIKQSKPKTMSKREQAEQYRELNEKRRRELGTSG